MQPLINEQSFNNTTISNQMNLMTGKRKISAEAILEYFKPLETWLDKTIKEHKIPLGWESKFRNYFSKT